MTFKCDLDLQPSRTNVSNGTSTPQGQQLGQNILKPINEIRSNGPDKIWMHTRTHIHQTKIVTAMSRFTASGLAKNNVCGGGDGGRGRGAEGKPVKLWILVG